MPTLTPAERDARRLEIIALREEGRTWREVGDAVGMSPTAALSESPAYSSTGEPPAWLSEVVRLYEAGARMRDVRAVSGASSATTRRWLRAAGVTIRPHSGDGDKIGPLPQELIDLYKGGRASLAMIGELHGCSRPIAARRLRAAGVEIRSTGRHVE